MINDYAEQLYTELKEELELFSEMGISPVKRVTGIISSIQAAFKKLKACLEEHPFASPEAEVYFFKYVKPKFIAEQIYAMEMFTIEISRPAGDEGLVKSFYQLELKYIERYLYRYRSLYQYFQYDETAFDPAYFIRGVQKPFLSIPDSLEPNPDPDFSTGFDYIFGRFIASERLLAYLNQKLDPENTLVALTHKPGLPYTGMP